MSYSFSESRINDVVPRLISTTGGPSFQTNIVVVASGHEQRNKNWSQALGTWQLGERVVDQTEKEALINFFNARKGKFQGFRFKDWADFYVSYAQGKLGTTGLGTGLSTYQLYKTYTDYGDTYLKKIVKPVSGTVIVKQDGVVIGSSIDTETGIVTLSPNTAVAISNIDKSSQGLVTTSGFHGLITGKVVFISGVTGMTQVNNKYYTINYVNSTQFQLQENTSTYSTYVSGGTVSVFPQATNDLTWTGQYDTPVRFDSDSLQYRLEEIITSNGTETPWFYLLALPIVEVRL